MCGIFGSIGARDDLGATELAHHAARAVSRLRHRGPDDVGTWVDETAGVALAHQRLAVIDLSEAGHQPMASASGRWVLTYNGEVYNHPAIRAELERTGTRFRGTSDSETLVEAIDHWGLEGAVARCNGMFAFGVWDRDERCLWLARDRMGEKPLYYGRSGDTFLFASELKAIRAHPAFANAIDRDALALYMRRGNVPAPWSIYEGIAKLPSATVVRVDGGGRPGPPQRYWDPYDAPQRTAGESELVDELDELLRDSVGMRMLADVPLGAFLSGGMDSSLVTALMQQRSEQPVRTFTIGFTSAAYDEAQSAKAVAAHLGTDHTELYVSPAETLAVLPELPGIWDEPFGDSSQVPTFIVARLARDSVTVALSGDGGDELFGGYQRYVQSHDAWRKLRRVPAPVRSAVRRYQTTRGRAHAPVPLRSLRPRNLFSKLGDVLSASDQLDLYEYQQSQWQHSSALVLGAQERTEQTSGGSTSLEPLELLMRQDQHRYLPDDILTKVDRATMSVSLESRAPLLDHRIVELAARLPLDLKVRDGRGKWILRQVLHRYVPQPLVDRPKQGFEVPIGAWLRGELQEWAGDLLRPGRLASDGFLDPAPVQRAWEQHQRSEADHSACLWTALMFQAWLDEADEVRSSQGVSHGP